MDTDTICERTSKIHQGLNIKRVRSSCQIKQEILALKLGIAQQTLSKYENQEIVDEEILNKCAKALDVPVELLKSMPENENAPTLFFKDVNFNNTLGSFGIINSHSNFTSNYSEKVVLKALSDEVERLKKENDALKSKQEKN